MVVFPADPVARLASSTRMSCSSDISTPCRHRARALEDDVTAHADHRLDVIAHIPGYLGDERFIGWGRGGELHLDRHGVHGSVTGEYDLIVRGEPGKAHEKGLDLGGIDVDAADDQHVIATPGDAHHPSMGAPACAWLLDQASDVAGAI